MTGQERLDGVLVQGDDTYKIAQALYHSVTGKTETVSKQFSENYRITFDDIRQLHAKFQQMCAQWKVLGQNENITVFHVDDNKEVFSSIDRIELYDLSQTSPIESITFEFTFLAALPMICTRLR